MYKFFVIAAIMSVVAARPQDGHGHGHDHIGYSSQSIHRHEGPGYAIHLEDKHGHKDIDYRAEANYEFEYKVEDGHTHDQKSQKETRHGDVVKGYYTVNEPDGTLRIVHYTADHKNGFNAVVERKGHSQHIEPAHH